MRLILGLMVLGLVANVYASPMLAPTFKEAVERSEKIVVAEYVGYEKPSHGEPGYFDSLKAQYRIVKTLKGMIQSEVIPIAYAFSDGSACIAPNDFKFSQDMMPAKGSRWILFLEREDGGVWETYRGSYGRWLASEENVKKIKEQL